MIEYDWWYMKKKIIISLLIIVTIIVAVYISVNIIHKNIKGIDCCLCDGVNIESSFITNCGENVSNCIGCCECKYTFIEKIKEIYNYYTN